MVNLQRLGLTAILKASPEQIRQGLKENLSTLRDDQMRAVMDEVLAEINRRWPKK